MFRSGVDQAFNTHIARHTHEVSTQLQIKLNGNENHKKHSHYKLFIVSVRRSTVDVRI